MHQLQAGKRARAALGWGLLVFVIIQLGVDIILDGWRRDVYDPEFGARLTALRNVLAEEPAVRLVVLLGSSRTAMSFRPELLPPLRTAAGEPVVPFNFSHFGGGPVFSVLQMARLLREGIHPDWVVLEILPGLLAREEPSTLTGCANLSDLPVLHHYIGPGKLYGRYLRARLVPCYRQRRVLCRDYAPEWNIEPLDHPIRLGPLGGDNGWWLEEDSTPESTCHRINLAREQYGEILQRFRVSDAANRAVRQVLELGRSHGIRFVLLLTPEGSEFRSWYSPQALAELDRYCSHLAQDYQVPVIDARRWVADRDFTDGHHVFARGAKVFTERLGHEVLEPLVQDRLPGMLNPPGNVPMADGRR